VTAKRWEEICRVAPRSFSASVTCSNYEVASTVDHLGSHGYYVRMPPKNCRARHLGEWRPTFRITEPWTNCKKGYRKYKNACYRLARGNTPFKFDEAERICNSNQGHVVTWKDRAEFMWIHNNIATQNKFHWVGIFCGQGTDLRNSYAVTGEDMRKIGPHWGFKGAHPLNNHGQPCHSWHRNNGHWMRHFHHRGCHDKFGSICKSPLVN